MSFYHYPIPLYSLNRSSKQLFCKAWGIKLPTINFATGEIRILLVRFHSYHCQTLLWYHTSIFHYKVILPYASAIYYCAFVARLIVWNKAVRHGTKIQPGIGHSPVIYNLKLAALFPPIRQAAQEHFFSLFIIFYYLNVLFDVEGSPALLIWKQCFDPEAIGLSAV